MKFLFLLTLSFLTTTYSQTPCSGITTVNYGGKIYNTVAIGNQCWLKENLDIGLQVDGLLNQTNNDTIEKYCYNNDPANCVTYGGLYQWAEAVQYLNGATNTSSPNPAFSGNVQGICPSGWHIPSLSEFNTLASSVKNDGNSLKAVGQGTGLGTGTDLSGFSALFAGTRFSDGTFSLLTLYNFFLSSTEFDATNANFLDLGSDSNFIYFGNNSKSYGRSVRCVKDESGVIIDFNCPESQGFWKNHTDNWPNILPMMLGTANSYGKDKLVKILHTPVRGDASIILAYQLITAKLNVGNISKLPDEIQKAITNSDNLIGSNFIPAGIRPNSSTGHKMILLAGLLDLYNNGRLTNCRHHHEVFPRHEPDKLDDLDSDGNVQNNPQDYKLFENFPNPFNPTTQISFILPQADFVTLKIYNSTGQLVRTLVNENMNKGYHTLEWNATNDNGITLASGIYLYRLQAGNFIKTNKMMFMK
jgi:uncharacterized protein (TIGR02145 family)